MPMVISSPSRAPATACPTVSANASWFAIRWSAANDAITARPPLRRWMTPAASAIAAQESLASGSTRMFAAGRAGSWRATDVACAVPVTTSILSAVDIGTSRSKVACSNDRSVPVSGCRNFGLPARDSGHNRVPLPPAGTTTYRSVDVTRRA